MPAYPFWTHANEEPKEVIIDSFSNIHEWTDIAPSTLSSGDNTLVAAPPAGSLTIIESIGFQNVGDEERTLILKKGTTAFRSWVLQSNQTLEISFEESREWRLTSAFVGNASAGTDLKITGGRYRVGES
jgi:hypothetical protein